MFGVIAVAPAVATLYFFVFWSWFGFWRRHPALTYAMMLGSFVGFAIAVVVVRDVVLAPAIAMPAPVRAVGWMLAALATIVGTIADRQIGFRVRSFMPFFDGGGPIHLETAGAYGIVRHPIYATGIAFQLGVFLVTGYLAVAASCAVFALGAQWFTRREEAALRELLADPRAYDAYRKRVPRLLPYPRRRHRTAPPEPPPPPGTV